jgi:hypothetical protein
MKKMSIWTLAAAVLFIAGSAVAATQQSTTLSATAYVNSGSGAATITVTPVDTQINCGTLNYGTGIAPYAAGDLCPALGTAPTAELDVTESAVTPFYMTLTDGRTGGAQNEVILSDGLATPSFFNLNLGVVITGITSGSGSTYTPGNYVTPSSATTPTVITITPTLHAAFPGTTPPPTGQYSGSVIALISF